MNGPRMTPVAVALLTLACQQSPDVVGVIGTSEAGTGSDGEGGTMGTDGSSSSANEPCEAIDILFVVDNSTGMTAYQQGLVLAVPTFVEGLTQHLPAGTDVHIGVTTSSFCDPAHNPAHLEDACEPLETDEAIASAFVPPDQGSVGPAGHQGRLLPIDDEPWARISIGQALSGPIAINWLSSALAPGDDGCEIEFNASAIAHALSSANEASNAGFLRPGARLGLFVLSDETDQSFVVESAIDLVTGVQEATRDCDALDCVVTAALLDESCTPAFNASHLFLSALDAGLTWGPIATVGSGSIPDGDYADTLWAFTERLGAACAG